MGSTDEKRCITLTTCDSNTESQNIHSYGVMLIAALSTTLLIIYKCSDQILTTRDRKYAKYREAAARAATEKTQARAMWKSTKVDARKRFSTWSWSSYWTALHSSTQLYRAKSNEIGSLVLAPKKEAPKEEPVDNNLDKQQQVVVVGQIYIKLCYGRNSTNND
ncbi:ABC transporter g family member 24 [Phtheirospermum japonicum]|uniref:ABC transporter g family member 24 n=1 Tax=Phtheirospermum japonicum TaxID=374723 RepID=A0A830CQC2_9LAMI|nr:ABC transporter g family member 24 [Phtheirospermum japonicum]